VDSSGSGYVPVVGFCKHGNVPSGSTVGGDLTKPLSASHEGPCSVESV
jgi:hypothetical protein